MSSVGTEPKSSSDWRQHGNASFKSFVDAAADRSRLRTRVGASVVPARLRDGRHWRRAKQRRQELRYGRLETGQGAGKAAGKAVPGRVPLPWGHQLSVGPMVSKMCIWRDEWKGLGRRWGGGRWVLWHVFISMRRFLIARSFMSYDIRFWCQTLIGWLPGKLSKSDDHWGTQATPIRLFNIIISMQMIPITLFSLWDALYLFV